jgi:hypothetical protein
MSHRTVQQLALIASLAGIVGCGRSSAAPHRDTSASDGSAAGAARECRILTAADVKAATGADVHLIPRGSSPGAGGTCGNYATADGEAYLGVNALQTASEYDLAVAAVPRDIYPTRRVVAGLGDQAILMKDETGRLRYLVARKGDRGVVLFPLGSGMQGISDDRLGQLAQRSLAAR